MSSFYGTFHPQKFIIKFISSDMDLIKNRLAKTVCDTYAIESMTYLTTGLIDGYENQDVDLEAAMLKVRLFLSLDSND